MLARRSAALLVRPARPAARSAALFARRAGGRVTVPLSMPLLRRQLCAVTARPPSDAYTTEDVVQWLRAERALNVTAFDVSHLLSGSVGESFVFATGRSQAHMLRIGKAVRHELKHRGVLMFGKPPTIEGKDSDDWLLVDGGKVVVSVMRQATRDRLALERHWEEQGAIPIELPHDPEEEMREATAAAAAAAAAARAVDPTTPAEVPPPRHWGGAEEPLEEIYRETADEAVQFDDGDAAVEHVADSDAKDDDDDDYDLDTLEEGDGYYDGDEYDYLDDPYLGEEYYEYYYGDEYGDAYVDHQYYDDYLDEEEDPRPRRPTSAPQGGVSK